MRYRVPTDYSTMKRYITVRQRVLLVALVVLCLFVMMTGMISASTVRLEFWSGFSGDDRDAMGKLVDKFNASQSAIKVNWTTYQWDQLNSKLIASSAVGNPPDVAATWYTVMPEMVSKGVLTDISAMASEAGITKDQFLPRAWELRVHNGKLYGIPLDLHQLALYVNLDHLKAAGLTLADVERPGKSDFVAVAEKLTRDLDGNGTIDQYGFGMLPTTQWPIRYWLAFLEQQGASMLSADLKKATFNSPEGREAMQFMADLIHKYKVSPANLADLNQGFLSGRVSMIINGPWMINSARRQAGLNFAIVKFPQIYKDFATWGQSHQLVLPKQNDRAKQQAAMEFIKFLTDNGLTWALGGQSPAKLSVLTDPEFKKMKEWQPFIESQPFSIMNPMIIQQTKIFTHDPSSPLVSVWEAVVQKRMTVAEALTEAEKRVNQILESER